MLEQVQAVRFIEELSSGRNRPWLIEAERWDGEIVEVVAKLGSAECGPGGLVREAYSAMLAADLGLPISEPFVVELLPDFVANLEPTQKYRANGQSLAFGSAFAPNMFSIQQNLAMASHLQKQATEAFTFDAGIINSDRLVTKPNCLTDGTSILLIDHELSLNLHGRGGFLFRDPWTPGALLTMTSGTSEHLFYSKVRASGELSYGSVIQALCAQLAGISPSRIDEYRDAVPAEWDKDAVAEGISEFLKELIVKADEFKNVVGAALS